MRRSGIKVCLTSEQKKLLEQICKSLGMDRSEVMRTAFMEYAKSLNLMKQKVQETVAQRTPQSNAISGHSQTLTAHASQTTD